MTVLILDTNALRRGQFTVKELSAWIRAVGDSADVIIPQVVIWEWAEHAAAAHATLTGQLQEFRVDPGLFDRPALDDPLTVTALVAQIERLLPSPARVWRAADAVFKQAVMDQVLQTGPAERKEGIKTGAADSLVQACVAEQLEQRRGTEAVLLATGDKGLRRHCNNRFADEILLVDSINELLQKLNAFAPAQEDLLEELEQELASRVRDPRSDIGAALQAFDMGYRIHLNKNATRSSLDVPVRDLARLGRLDLLEIHDLRIATQEGAGRVGLADIRIFADIHMTQLELRPSAAGAPEWLTTYDGTIPQGFVDLTVAITWNQHWDLLSVEPTTEAVLVFGTSDYEDLDDVAPFHAEDRAATKLSLPEGQPWPNRIASQHERTDMLGGLNMAGRRGIRTSA